MPKFSVIMPSRLIPYQNSAQYPDEKLRRAVKSVLDQEFKDFELRVISDECSLTKKIITNEFTDKRLFLHEVRHKVLFDNAPRNKGIEQAKGEFIIYCDADDFWGKEHLKIIAGQLKDLNWVWYNDYIVKNNQWMERPSNVRQIGMCGTSNICHASKLGATWGRPGYAHDYYFIKKLLSFSYHKKIETPEYFVCHIPGPGGYDL